MPSISAVLPRCQPVCSSAARICWRSTSRKGGGTGAGCPAAAVPEASGAAAAGRKATAGLTISGGSAAVGGDFGGVAGRRGDDAHVNLNLARRADAVERVGLNRAQELRLELRRELRYLVQKDRAVVGQLPQAQLAPLRAGERARLVA